MTEHAIERLAERVKGLNPKEALTQIIDAITKGHSVEVCVDLSGRTVHEVTLSNLQTVFALMNAESGAIITVLVEGMNIETSTERRELRPTRLSTGVHRIPDTRYHADPCAVPSLSAKHWSASGATGHNATS